MGETESLPSRIREHPPAYQGTSAPRTGVENIFRERRVVLVSIPIVQCQKVNYVPNRRLVYFASPPSPCLF